ncbi:MAG TPA: dTMP kinase [Chloroflexi bacterium]|nr:dTMP kinase [Chloroflexota bacterium]HBY06803.1 dTMP kinase [Chloroflexota bacterium]
MFITFEGPEGSGKTTQIPQLQDYLVEAGYTVFCTREPGGTAIGDQIREVLLANKNTAMHPRSEILLFQASRAQLVEQEILPRLQRHEIVLCDRYADSTLAYQGYGHGVDLAQLRGIVDFATGGLKPDLTLLFDLDVEIGLSRRQKDGDINRLDAFALDFHRRVRAGYHALAAAEPQRWQIIDATQPPEQVQAVVREVVLAKYSLN